MERCIPTSGYKFYLHELHPQVDTNCVYYVDFDDICRGIWPF